MTTSTRLNAFLWNRVSQGYSRVVQEAPPFASWQAWRRGGTSQDLSTSLYRTPPPPSLALGRRARNRSRSSEERDSTTEQEQQEQVGPGRGETVTAREKEKARNNPIRCGSATNFDGDNDNMDCGGVLAATATFDGSHEWALTFPTPDLSRGASQATASAGALCTGDPSDNYTRLLFALDVPKGMAVTDVQWTISRVEDVSSEHGKSKIAPLYSF